MPDYMSLFGALQCHCLKCYSVTVSSAMMSPFEALQRHCLECYDVTVSPILSIIVKNEKFSCIFTNDLT